MKLISKALATSALCATAWLAASAATAAPLTAADKSQLTAAVDAYTPKMNDAALKIWSFAELGYQETKSSALLQDQLKAAGFKVQAGVAGEPTGFVASFKNGTGPVIAILAEFDALPGLSQAAVPTKQPIAGQDNGHGCGHSLFGAASVASAVALKQWMVANKVQGEVRVYGTPAEEGGSGKVYMVRDGLFNDVDITLHWHPGNTNSANQGTSMANISGKFRFYGQSSHASGAPWAGRSALDGVEIMNVANNYLREHIPDRTRIHYVVTNGGKAPNVVPDFAEVYYYVRNADPKIVVDVMDRVKKAAEGAAMITGTKVEFEQTGGVYNLLPNDVLGKVMYQSLNDVGGITWTAEETKFAQQLAKSLPNGGGDLSSVGKIQPYKDADTSGDAGGGSTDVADVSWVTPTVGLSTATFVPGSAGHSWQNVAAAGMSIGLKGAAVAAKTLSLTGAELLSNPELIAQAKAELKQRQGADFNYKSMVGDRKPPLDYRKAGGAE
ncbi:aminobenzoyl-glutamate utilization protein B [Phenylobacterium haematophilum]|uniref:Aminobenzoyl-glutamate utilization protein B n=1 Tax=Phenylobacterium haematophilum TaxID=98513 RepID=A0A840A007_9CAUL|nr:amidohydrolase [Phenylobacterium haematophilum]MBB3891946.1 aminobenzoyl-glutamate utilization protein B [Phenylobacterium haematophilum]